jgi:osmoprotectant transport system ATP-binding protein
MADKIAIFKDGKLVQYDTPEAILMRPANKFVSDFVGADRALKVLGLLRIRDAMNPNPKNVVQADRSAEEVMQMMEERRMSFAFVIKDNRPVGYLLPKLLKYEHGRVGELAEKFHGDPGTAARCLVRHADVRCQRPAGLLDDNGGLAGTISYKNIQKSILELYAEDQKEE